MIVISRGVLHEVELIPIFAAELRRRVGKDRGYDDLLLIADIAGDDPPSQLVHELLQALDDLAPEGMYFGIHKDDATCFGFFPIEEE